MQRTNPPNDVFELREQIVSPQVGLSLQAEKPSFPFEKWPRVIQTKGGGKKSVIADARVEIERQVRAVEREVVIERQFQGVMQCGPVTGRNPGQNKTVMHDEQINPLLHGHLHRSL